MDRPTVFLSYSHEDKRWLEDLRTMLSPLVRSGIVDVWWDGAIKPSQEWRKEIDNALATARIGVLLVSPNFLASDFIAKEELPYLIKAAEQRGVTLIWVLLSPCLFEHTPLKEIQAAHVISQPLDSLRKAKRRAVLKEICEKIAEAAGTPASTTSSLSRGVVERERKPGSDVRLAIGRLPIPSPLLIGRETELNRLDAAWKDPAVHVLTLVAFGGMGKSALVSHWMGGMAAAGWPGARRVFDWSFYSQGTEERVTSAERFFDEALSFFGDPDPKVGAPRDRGLRLAELIRCEKTLLVLDGVEPLQHPPTSALAGRLKDPGLAALLKSLAGGNPGLCVVTTRERITDLDAFPKTAPQEDLEALSAQAGAELLRRLKVVGKDSELLAASEELRNHALAVTLLGGYLTKAKEGDVRRRKDIDLAGADAKKGGHALRVIGAYARWLGEGPELAVLRLTGLFDRPASPKALVALRTEPAIPGLTDTLAGTAEEDWISAVSTLREYGLLLPADPKQPGTLDAHPLVRVFFQEDLETNNPEAWKAGNLRLYKHLQKEAPDLPDTLEEMEPLFTAVLHGCRAGRQQEACDEVYWRRIQRGNKAYSLKKLGAFGSDLTALSGFFDHLWDRPSAGLHEASQGFVLNQAGTDLRALGRLTEAIQPMEAGLERFEVQKNWENAAVQASNLSELTLTLGEMERALAFGRQSVELADRSGDAFWRIASRTTLADDLHQAGRWEESAEAFREAEALQAEWQPRYPRLYSVQGYQYCDLLLSHGEPENGSGPDGLAATPEAASRLREACQEVRGRAEETIKIAERNNWLLDISLDHLSLGRSHLGLALTAAPGEEAEPDFARAAEHLDRAMEGLRASGAEHHLPRGLLARSTLRRFRNDLPGAEADLSEALEIAERGLMRLFECDAHLEWARLCRQRRDGAGAEGHVEIARRIVKETGYGRREREVAYLSRPIDADFA